AAPETPVETRLAQIWAEVLRLPEVGIRNNFFALGGDSILSIQIVARARQAGVQLTPRQIFQYQTIAELATVAGTTTTVTAEQGLVTGSVPLTPIQHWFFGREHPEPHHWNQARLLEVGQPLDVMLLRQAIRQLLIHHDALRLRFIHTSAGWQQQHAAVEDVPEVVQVDLTEQSSAAQATAMEKAATELQSSLDLANGPLMRVALFTLGAGQPDRLLIIIHHLVVDKVSWGILLEDLWTAYDQLQRGVAVALPPKTTSFQQWAKRLHAYAQSETLRQELDYWLTFGQHAGAPLPVDYPGGVNTVESARDVVVALSAAETDLLLRELPPVYRTQINDVLLTALVQACASSTGAARLLVDLEGHGREELFDDVDLTRTVGWFTTLYPVLLDLREAEGPGQALKAIKEQLRQIPNRGIGDGVLRYLSTDELATELGALPQAQISFNYLGQSDQSVATDGLFVPAREPRGPNESSRGSRSHVLEINALVVTGELHVHWTYSAALHDEATIAALAERYLAALRALIAHGQSPTAGGFTPSDFPLARLDQARLDQLLGADRLVDDLYPLSPMQQGMLFHTLYETDAGMYITQFVCTIPQIEVAAFQRAWQYVVDRHPILRTAFVWEGLPTPLQIVRRQVAVPWTVEDWRDLDAATQTARLDAVVASDRRQGFDLAQAPLLRLALFRVTETAYHFLWSEHSLLLDGWSGPLVLNEVLSAYAALVTGQALPAATPRPFRDYIAWLDTQDPRQAEDFWRQTLAGFTAPTPLGVDQSLSTTTDASGYAEQVITLPEPSSAALHTLTRQHGLTLNTVVQGAWALLLSRYSGENDVVFGATVAGRPADLPGVETMVGLFINTLPVRVRVPQDALLLPWLQQLQGQQAELRQYEHSPLVQIQGWSAVPRGQPLFESLVVFENFPVAVNESASDERAILDLQQVRAIEQVNYPLTLASSPGYPLRLHLSYDRRRFDDATIERMLGHLAMLLSAIAEHPTQRLGKLPLLTTDERTRLLDAWPVTPAPAPPRACLHELVAAQAARTPDAVAVVFGDRSLTYRELDQCATQLAYALRQRGVGPEVPVALLLERSPDQIVALLAILKACGAYLPLDPTLPAARLQFVLADAQVPLLLTQSALLPTLPPHTAEVLCLDAAWPQIAQAPSVPLPTVGPEHLAYVIYTSGSTGQPKGVLVPHRGIANLAQQQIAAFGVTAASRVLQFAALSFAAALSEVAMALLAGATLVLASRDALLPGPELLALLREQAITQVTLPPSVLAALPEAELPALH
ncbi:MAG TPA: condensation domain-containing protein, partial [Herpetosiphonaceae bacterium]